MNFYRAALRAWGANRDKLSPRRMLQLWWTAPIELPDERLLSVDAAWRLMRGDHWEEQREVEVIMGPLTSLWIAHDHCVSEVFWPTPHQNDRDQERRALAAGRDRNGEALAATVTAGATAATVAEAEVAVAT